MIPPNSFRHHMPTTASSLFSTYASFAGTIMLVRSVANEVIYFIPSPLRSYIYSTFNRFFTSRSSSDLTLFIEENFDGEQNQVFEAAELYLGTKSGPSTGCFRVGKTPRQNNISLAINKGQEIIDTFDEIKLKWSYVCTRDNNDGGGGGGYSHLVYQQKPRRNSSWSIENRYYKLTFHKKHKDQVVDSYLPYVVAQANAIKEERKVIKIYSRSIHGNGINNWQSVKLEHPFTFETLAMEPELKRTIVEDLDRFLRRREFYKKVGKAWKRGYLLYGPPGTGKSSLIAAMANYLKFDIYDLELTSIYHNSELKRILLSTTNRSILVIEDIDCSIDLQNRELEEQNEEPSSTNGFTLSGLLNFIDGLWSSCGDERIIVFTTNHKHLLDPALLRPGRMDVHIHMSYCTPGGFKVLASNYHGIHEDSPHQLCGEIEGLIESTEVTPAEIAEELMKTDETDVALEGLVNFLKRKRVENDKRKADEEAKKNDEAQEAKRQKTDDDIENQDKTVAKVGPPKRFNHRHARHMHPSMMRPRFY